jgi:hypothetical protein
MTTKNQGTSLSSLYCIQVKETFYMVIPPKGSISMLSKQVKGEEYLAGSWELNLVEGEKTQEKWGGSWEGGNNHERIL